MLSAKLKKELTSAFEDSSYNVFGIPQPEDPLQWLLGDRIERYQELLLDPDIISCLQKRTYAVVAAEWEVQQASKDKKDELVARFVRWCLEEIQFDKICLELLEALVLGYKVAEIIWTKKTWVDEETKKKFEVVCPEDIRTRDSHKFTFVKPEQPSKNATLWGYELRFLTLHNPIQGTPLPDKKFIIHSIGSKTSNPFGVGLGSALYWPHEFKKQAVMSALTFGDRFAQPTVIGKHLPEQNPKKLEQFVRSITEGTSGVLPDGMEVFLLEASRSSSVNFYEWLIEWCENQIKKVILSEMMSGAPQGLSGQPAQNDENVREEITKLDADVLCNCLNSTLVKWLVEFNFPDRQQPKVWRLFPESEDLNSRVNRDNTLQGMGWKLTEEKFAEVYGSGYEKEGNDVLSQINSVLSPSTNPEDSNPNSPEPEPESNPDSDVEPSDAEPSDAESNNVEPIDNSEFVNLSDPLPEPIAPLIQQTATQIDGQITDWLSSIRGLISRVSESGKSDAEKYQDFQDQLIEIQPSVDKMGAAIAQSSLVADMGGRYDVLQEIEEDQ